MSEHKRLGQKIITGPIIFFSLIFLIGLYFMVWRFVGGIGAVTNLNGGFGWGIWVIYDVVVGTAFACGGYALAFTVYLFNKGRYHPLVRTALLTSLLGYALGGFAATFDMGLYWQFYSIFLPWRWNFNSVMLEVGLCVALYVGVLAIEFSPVVLEWLGAKKLLNLVNKALFFFIALGLLLPSMHQSSLGSLLIALGHKVHPLWQSLHFQPLLALITALTMGFSIVIYEASLTTVSYRRTPETPLLAGLGKVIMGLLIGYLVIRFGLLIIQDKLGYLAILDRATLLFAIETVLFVFPVVVLSSARNRSSGPLLLFAAVSMLLGGALYRLNAFLLNYNPGPGYEYFPSAPEIFITLGLIALEIVIFLVIIRLIPVLPRDEHA